MGRKSFAVDLLNQFVIDNFIPYAWSNLWEITDPEETFYLETKQKKIIKKQGLFFFRFCVRPNDYHRNDIHSTNAMNLPAVQYSASYTISIPMLVGSSVTKRNTILDEDPKLKWIYTSQLARKVVESLELLETNSGARINTVREVFGDDKKINSESDGWDKVRSYENNDQRSNWSFV